MNCRGAYTVEAVFVITICIWVLFALCTGGLYIHDREILVSETNEVMAESMEQEAKDVSAQVKERLTRKLFFLRLENVSVKDGVVDRKVTVRYTFSSYLTLLRTVWLKGKSYAEYRVARDRRKPAEYRWDSEIVK